MFCSKCGNKTDDRDPYCRYCGARIEMTENGLKENPSFAYKKEQNPVFSIQPQFKPTLILMTVFPFQLFASIWGAFFFGGLLSPVFRTLYATESPFEIQFICGIILFITIPAVYYYVTKKNYSKSWYRFYPDKLEFYEGFFVIQEKTIKYKNITELNLRRGFLQRRYGLGTIIISTPATGFSRGRAVSGIRIKDIQEPEIAYIRIKEMVDKAASI